MSLSKWSIEKRIARRAPILGKDECWPCYKPNPKGYGYIWVENQKYQLHRFTYEYFIGPIPEGMHMDHYRWPDDGCVGPACCNPWHVRPVTPWENLLRGANHVAGQKARTHCKRGHPYEPPYLRIKKNGARDCKECARIRQALAKAS